jgi:O-antigen/teichoic acid export membrane protein
MVAQYGAAGIGLVTTLVAARWLGPEAFGLAAVIMAYPAAVFSFASVKTSSVTQRYASGFRATGRRDELLAVVRLGFTVDFGVSLVAVALVTVAVVVVGDLPGTAGQGDLVTAFALSLPMMSFAGTGFVVLSAFGLFGMAAALQLGEKAVVLLAVVGALLIDRGSAAFVLASAAGQAAAGLAWLLVSSAVLARRTGRWWWTASWRSLAGLGVELRSLFGWNFVGVTLSGAMSQLPVVLLGAMRSPVEAGYFRLASTIAVTADYVEAAMSRVAYPLLASSDAEGDVAKTARLVRGWSRREAPVATLIVLAAMAALPLFVAVVFGDEYGDMIAGAEVLLAGVAVSTAFFFVFPYLYATGQVRTWVFAYGTYAAFALGTGALLAPSGGFLAFAVPVGLGLAALNFALGAAVLRQVRPARASR